MVVFVAVCFKIFWASALLPAFFGARVRSTLAALRAAGQSARRKLAWLEHEADVWAAGLDLTRLVRNPLSAAAHLIRAQLARKNYMSGLFNSRQARAYRTISYATRLAQRPTELLRKLTARTAGAVSAAAERLSGSRQAGYLPVLAGAMLWAVSVVAVVVVILL